jgi:hypothetical protein
MDSAQLWNERSGCAGWLTPALVGGEDTPKWPQNDEGEGCPALQNAEELDDGGIALLKLGGTADTGTSVAGGTAVLGSESSSVAVAPGGVGVDRALEICNLSATLRACATWLFTTSGAGSAHICKALIEPHSIILLFNQSNETGLVRKSLHPAPSAATRSLCNEEAVRATMITAERYGEEVLVVSDESDGVRGMGVRPFCNGVLGG